MRLGRLLLVVATLVAILVFPLVMKDALTALKLPSAYAAPNPVDPTGRVFQNGNFDSGDNDNNNDGSANDDNNDESDNEGEDNENEDVCYDTLNENAEEVDCDFDDNGNYDDYVPPAYSPPASAPAPASSGTSKCFSAQESGNVELMLSGGSVIVRVVPGVGFPSSTELRLSAVDPATVPAPPAGATVLDSLVWNLEARTGCGGSAVTQLPGAVNLGVPYTVSADKSKLQIVRLDGSSWVNVDTVPDPSTSYISATIQQSGTYAVIQRP
jgi:hypothetical protein